MENSNPTPVSETAETKLVPGYALFYYCQECQSFSLIENTETANKGDFLGRLSKAKKKFSIRSNGAVILKHDDPDFSLFFPQAEGDPYGEKMMEDLREKGFMKSADAIRAATQLEAML